MLRVMFASVVVRSPHQRRRLDRSRCARIHRSPRKTTLTDVCWTQSSYLCRNAEVEFHEKLVDVADHVWAILWCSLTCNGKMIHSKSWRRAGSTSARRMGARSRRLEQHTWGLRELVCSFSERTWSSRLEGCAHMDDASEWRECMGRGRPQLTDYADSWRETLCAVGVTRLHRSREFQNQFSKHEI